MDSGESAIEDAGELARVKAQARKVIVQSVVVAAVVTAVLMGV